MLSIQNLISAESVFSRDLSAMKDERMKASKILTGPTNVPEVEKYKKASFEEKKDVIEQIRRVSCHPNSPLERGGTKGRHSVCNSCFYLAFQNGLTNRGFQVLDVTLTNLSRNRSIQDSQIRIVFSQWTYLLEPQSILYFAGL